MARKIVCDPVKILQTEDGGLKWSWYFRLTEPASNGYADGTYERVWTDPPEPELTINADFPGRIAAQANIEGVDIALTAEDVYGGRL